MKIKPFSFSDIVYALFLISGMIKSCFLYYGIKPFVDLTLTLAILLTLNLIYTFLGSSLTIRPASLNIKYYLVLLVLFLGLSYFSLLYTPSSSFSYHKSGVMTLNLLAFLYPCIKKKFDLDFVFKIIYLIVIPYSVFIIFLNTVRWTPYNSLINIESADLVRGNYLGVGLFLGLISHFYLNRNHTPLSYVIKVLLPVFLLFLSSARGPLIFFILTIVLRFLIINNWKLNKKAVYTGLTAILLIIISPIRVLIINIFERTMVRFGHIFLDVGGGTSIQGRLEYLGFVWDMMLKNSERILFGYGIGSFSILYNGTDGRGYPHNILLESLFELGIFGLIIISMLAFGIYFAKKDNLAKLSPLFVLLCFSKSGGLEDTRIVFATYVFFLLNLYSQKRHSEGNI